MTPLKRPTDVLSEHPEIKKVWGPAILGYLHAFGLIRGKKVHRGCLVDEKDVINIFRYRDRIAIDRLP